MAGLFGAIAFTTWWTGRVDLRPGSHEVGGSPIRVTNVAETYHAVYEVSTYAQKKATVTTERVWVRRPFDSRIETWSGKPPGTSRLSVRQSGFGALSSESANSVPLNITVPPSLASGDLRVDAALKDALAKHIVVRRERRDVYGRQCQIYRAGSTILAGDMVPYKGGTKEYADFCVDRTGIVVEEMWYSRGALLRRRVARSVEVDLPINPKTLSISTKHSPELDPGSVEHVGNNPIGRPYKVLELPKTPKGFESLGRYAVIISSAAVPQTGGALPAPGPSSTTDVYVRGPDLLVIDQDPSLEAVTQNDSRPKRRVHVSGLAAAQLIIDARMSEVRGATKDGSYVRIFGTISPTQLLKFARELRAVRG